MFITKTFKVQYRGYSQSYPQYPQDNTNMKKMLQESYINNWNVIFTLSLCNKNVTIKIIYYKINILLTFRLYFDKVNTLVNEIERK